MGYNDTLGEAIGKLLVATKKVEGSLCRVGVADGWGQVAVRMAVVGVPGSGKSTVCRGVSEKLNVKVR